eukprot:m.242101 g.242101  ORF g.242101 m.242101 type:complete len:57 (+) comp17132_c0_seq5:626-796(+)
MSETTRRTGPGPPAATGSSGPLKIDGHCSIFVFTQVGAAPLHAWFQNIQCMFVIAG